MDPHFYITESTTVLHRQPSHQLLLLKLLDPQVLILIKYSKRRKKIPVKSRFNLILILRKIKVQKIQQMRTLGIFKQLVDFLTCINKLLFINEISFGQGWCTLCMIKSMLCEILRQGSVQKVRKGEKIDIYTDVWWWWVVKLLTFGLT